MGYSKVWNDLLDTVYDITEKNKINWFRGHCDESYELKSGLFRYNFSTIEDYLKKERTNYGLFLNMGHSFHREQNWNLLYVMQHFGVRTRLLDWSESFAVALYFATLGWKDSTNCVVWILSPIKLNYLSIQTASYYTPTQSYESLIGNTNANNFHNTSLALFPLRNNARIVAQQGVFTLQGNSTLSLDKEFNAILLEQGILKKIVITPDLMSDVIIFLKHSGVNHFTLFPDLDGLSKLINES